MVTIVLDKERRMRLTLRGMIAYEEATGKSMLGGINTTAMSSKDLCTMAWACLIHDDKDLTLDTFIDSIEFGDIPRLVEAVSKCIVESFPDKGESKEAPLADRSG